MTYRIITFFIIFLSLVFSVNSFAHYPILNCEFEKDKEKPLVECVASFSDNSIASNVVMEVYSEEDELIAKGKTDEAAIYRFEPSTDVFFIIMDAGPGHVLEISDEEVVR